MVLLNRTFVWSLIGLSACSLALAGCQQEKEERIYRTVRGIARSKDPASGRVSMDFTRKNGHVVELEGRVTQDTEIFVNGRVATLDDVRLGEEVEVTGYVTDTHGEKNMVVTQVVVTRGETEPVTPVAPAGEVGQTQPSRSQDPGKGSAPEQATAAPNERAAGYEKPTE